MLVSWNWLKEYVGETELTATKAAELLGVHSFEIEEIDEQEKDTVLDIDVLPNRSSDCMSHRGIARELASITGMPLSHDPLSEEPELPTTDLIKVDIEDEDACPRFTASLITGVTIKESPEWLKERLEAIGQRSINNIVDATNYVMYAIGQPLHAYDAELFPQVDGHWQFEVRAAKEGEAVSLLPEGASAEDRIVELKGGETLIVDGSSNTPIGLAGVKGGRFAGVHEGTTQVIIEAANFHPTRTRKTARPLGIITDAGKRFENEVSREMVAYAQAEITKLIIDIAGGELQGFTDTYLIHVENPEVNVSVARVNALLGLTLVAEEMEDILKRIGCTVASQAEGFAVVGPWERTDLCIEEDFIEEIGRLHGYADVTSVTPEPVALKQINKRHYYAETARKALIELGFSEVITSSFRKKDMVQLRNALASDKSYMRSSLIKNLSEVLDNNAGFTDLLGTPDTRVFEIGAVFYKSDETVIEHVALGFGTRIKQSGYSGKEDKIISAATEALEAALGITFVSTVEKGVAEINLTGLLDKLPDPEKYESVEVGKEIVYRPFSVYQHMSRDIAMWMDESVLATDVEQVLNENAGELRVRTTLFDEFAKDGRKSLAFRLVFQSYEKTLTDDEVNAVMENVNAAVAAQGWEVR